MQDIKKEKKTGWQGLVDTITCQKPMFPLIRTCDTCPCGANDPTSGCWVLPNSINVAETLNPPPFYFLRALPGLLTCQR